ncbi:MAG: alkaline phosphatase family protein, partial [Rhodothermales bacterium]
ARTAASTYAGTAANIYAPFAPPKLRIMMHILFLFIDGIGLGDDDPSSNPFVHPGLTSFRRLGGERPWYRDTPEVDRVDHVFHGIDARLDVEGLPQSGTGQASLFTGVNCAELAGRHYGPYPHSQSRPVLAEKNIFHRIRQIDPGGSEPVAFANAYPSKFFDYVKRTDRWTVTTRCCLDAGVRIRTEDDLREGRAVPADITGRRWPSEIAAGMMPTSESDAARRLLRIASTHRFTLFEYYMTDKAGHAQSMSRARGVLQSLDALLDGILAEMNPEETLLVLTSDHGNLEDLSIKTHTLNRVPFLAYGSGAGALRSVRTIDDVTPALLNLMSGRQ